MFDEIEYKKFNIFAIIFLILLGSTIYFNSLNVPFYFDDLPNLVDRSLGVDQLSVSSIREKLKNAASPSRPVSNFSFLLNNYFCGFRVQGYHLINIAIHIGTGIFLYLLLSLTLEHRSNSHKYPDCNRIIAFCTATLWIAHPLATNSVTYIIQRMNSLSSMFYILSLLMYVYGRNLPRDPGYNVRKKKIYFFSASILAGILALGSKEMTVTLPIIVFLYEWFFFQDLSMRWVSRKVVILIGAVGFLLLMSYCYTNLHPWQIIINSFVERDFSVYERLITQFRVITHYISLLAFPHPDRLALDYNFGVSSSLLAPISTLYSLFFLVTLFVIAIFLAPHERFFSFCIFWYFITLSIESSIIGLEIIFEHRTYLPSMFFLAIPISFTARIMGNNKFLFLCIFLPVALIFSLWTINRNNTWLDPLHFWQDNLSKYPENARVHNNYGLELKKRGLFDLAEKEFRTSILIMPEAPYSKVNLGNLLWRRGEYSEAERWFHRAIKSEKTYIEAFQSLSYLLHELRRDQEALQIALEGLELSSENDKLNKLAGQLLVRLGRPKIALSYFRKVQNSGNDDVEIFASQGEAYMLIGNREKAIIEYEKALIGNPKILSATYNLAIMYQSLEEYEIAEGLFRKAITLSRNFDQVPIRYNFANFLFRQGNLVEAKYHYKKLLEKAHILANAHINLGLIFLQQQHLDKARQHFLQSLAIDPTNKLAEKNLYILDMISGDEETRHVEQK